MVFRRAVTMASSGTRLLFAAAASHALLAQQDAVLQWEATIQLPAARGRIDHLSIDVNGERLFVAALENNSVEVLDLKASKLLRSLTGFQEPQGAFYEPSSNRLYIANRKDGTLRIVDAGSSGKLKSVPLNGNADNVRYDAAREQVYVGYGNGALGVMDRDGNAVANFSLDAHPESFQLEKNGPRIFVNLPGTKKIAVLNRQTRKVVATWQTGGPQANYAMALDEEHHRLFVVCRSPARVVVLDTNTGMVVQSLETVGDCDDVFYDAARKRVYVIGGEGAIAVIQQENPDRYLELARVKTRPGARTGLFSLDFNRVYVAARREGTESAAILIYKVQH